MGCHEMFFFIAYNIFTLVTIRFWMHFAFTRSVSVVTKKISRRILLYNEVVMDCWFWRVQACLYLEEVECISKELNIAEE